MAFSLFRNVVIDDSVRIEDSPTRITSLKMLASRNGSGQSAATKACSIEDLVDDILGVEEGVIITRAKKRPTIQTCSKVVLCRGTNGKDQDLPQTAFS
jgi:hypothetical protein